MGAVGPGKIGAIAPVLAGAKEEDLDAEKAAVLEDRENIRLLDIARIDVLVRLHGRQRREPIAQYGGALEIERLGRLVHFACEIFLYGAAPARQELLRLPHQLVIGGARYLARAGRRAALDLVEQARSRAAVEHGVRAGPDQEGALQRRDGAVHGVDGRERPEIVAFAVARPPMLQDLGRPLVLGNQNIRKRFVVAQQDVEAGPQALDQVRFKQQRLGFGRGGDEFD